METVSSYMLLGAHVVLLVSTDYVTHLSLVSAGHVT